MDREQEIQLQFLDEAQEYIETLETGLIGLVNGIDTDRINAALRAAHSIKGGAGMMGFPVLSELAHRLEDSLKVLKIQKNSLSVDPSLEHLLLTAVIRLRQVIEFDQREMPLDVQWLSAQVNPIFDELHERLGDPQAEDAYSILSPEEGQDILPLLFQTEVEESLCQLEQAAAERAPDLKEQVERLADELDGLGEMLQLPTFSHLCQLVKHHLITAPDRIDEITQAALQAWRRSQALILTGHLDELPESIAVAGVTLSPQVATPMSAPELEFDDVLLLETESLTVNEEGEAQQVSIRPLSNESEPTGLQPVLNQATSAFKQSLIASSLSEVKLNTPTAEPQENTVRVSVKQLDRLNDLFGELTIERNGLDLNLKRLRGLMRTLTQRIQVLEQSNTELRDVYDKVATQRPDATALLSAASSNASRQLEALNTRFDALELDRYDAVHPLSQEVMETIVQIQEVTSDLELGLDEAEQTARELNKTARQLQSNLTQVRMRPLSDVTDRFPRALRELSLQYGKPVQLQVEDGNTLIDRNILDALSEPLLHLVRNAFDHGIESAEVRQAWGKPVQGTITIRAFHQNNRTLITVNDDGGGIPLDKIRARARQMGLDEILLAAASDEEVLSLIFEPGFSTSEQVTALSGRGVGMDVVRSRLKQVQGEIEVDTQTGIGTTFTLSVPFTLSVMRVLIAESNGLLMAFPTNALQEMMLSPEQVISTAGNEAFTWNGVMVQLIRLKQWLTFNCSRLLESPEGTAVVGVPTVLLLAQGNQLVGLEVDRCWGEQEVAIRKIHGGPALPPGFGNCTILGDGRVVPLVNTPDLLRWLASCQRFQIDSNPQSALMLSPMQTSLVPSRTPRSVLIVDDSINVRRFLALTLEKAGYQVIQAKDGQEALDKLATGITVQAVVCDIEMPRLDGYGFLARLKANPTYEQIPVAMLTTRSSDKHRQLALSLGAAAYFSKPFNEQVLLQALDKLVTVLS